VIAAQNFELCACLFAPWLLEKVVFFLIKYHKKQLLENNKVTAYIVIEEKAPDHARKSHLVLLRNHVGYNGRIRDFVFLN
jgi:hypothetical protein